MVSYGIGIQAEKNFKSIAPGDLRYYLVPGPGDQETLVHKADHRLKVLQGDARGQDINGNKEGMHTRCEDEGTLPAPP